MRKLICSVFCGVLGVCLFFTSCKKEGSIGLGTQTSQVSSEFKDTSTVLSYNVLEDSLKTSKLDYTLIGSYNDPVFGQTTGSLYTQLSLPGNQTNIDLTGGPAFGTQSELVLDSVVLTLQYASTSANLKRYYGSLDAQTFQVYKINEDLHVDSGYYSNHKVLFDSLTPIGTKTFIPQPDSLVSIKGSTIKRAAHLRIKLDSLFGVDLLNQSATANLASTSAFQQYLKGIHVGPANSAQASGEGAILYFALTSTETKLNLYYRRRTSAPQKGDTLSFGFELNTTSARFTQFRHNYGTTAFASEFDNKIDSDFIYIQSMAGTKTKIEVPYLKNLTAIKSKAINKAEVLLKVDGSSIVASTITYDPHPQLFLMAIDSGGVAKFPVDYYDATIGYGGTFNTTTNEYRFNITRHIQAIVNGEIKDYGFYLLAGGSAVNANRVVMKGAGKGSDKLKLRLTYTNVN